MNDQTTFPLLQCVHQGEVEKELIVPNINQPIIAQCPDSCNPCSVVLAGHSVASVFIDANESRSARFVAD